MSRTSLHGSTMQPHHSHHARLEFLVIEMKEKQNDLQSQLTQIEEKYERDKELVKARITKNKTDLDALQYALRELANPRQAKELFGYPPRGTKEPRSMFERISSPTTSNASQSPSLPPRRGDQDDHEPRSDPNVHTIYQMRMSSDGFSPPSTEPLTPSQGSPMVVSSQSRGPSDRGCVTPTQNNPRGRPGPSEGMKRTASQRASTSNLRPASHEVIPEPPEADIVSSPPPEFAEFVSSGSGHDSDISQGSPRSSRSVHGPSKRQRQKQKENGRQ
ncbi:hypothetical protein DFH27DRAFT_545060 [Peziza echinospora]|nr:hypothetical protein DFH27DRAFT_545060 [Peziza echinospora]